MPSLPKDHAFMDRPYSGKAILFDMLRTDKTVKIRDYEKKLKAAGRKITALPRILYWVDKAVQEYGYQLEHDIDKDGEVRAVSLVKLEEKPKSSPKKEKSSKSKSKKSSSKKSKPASKKTSKSSKKTKPAKKSKKDESESESESAESESSRESEDESAEG